LGLLTDDDRNLTPRGKKTQGLLALLALAPRGTRTRVWLRDKLWSCSDEKKSASSLRQTVFELRKDLGPLADDILDINRLSIGLRLDRVWIDHHALGEDPTLFAKLDLTEETDLLEGIDVADAEFEDWLQIERQAWYDRACDLAEAQEDAAKAKPKSAALLPGPLAASPAQLPSKVSSIGFLPNIQQGCDAQTIYLADYVQEGVARNLREFEPVAIFDFREPGLHSDHLSGAFETEYYTRVRTLQVRDNITLSFFLYRSSQMALEWSQSIQTGVGELADNNFVLEGFIAQNVDRVARSIFEDRTRAPQGEKQTEQRFGYTALNLMFKLDENALENSERILIGAEEDSDSTVYPALRAYLSTFKVGENIGSVSRGDLEDIRLKADMAFEKNPFNSISLACTAHALGYIFHEHELAGNLLEKALNLNASQPFVWDHYALHKLYTGDFEAAYHAAERCAQLGAFSPISYSYDTTLAMAATMVGQHGRAIAAGQRALRKQPRFAAAMRFLTVNYAQLGREDEAADMMSRLLVRDPDFADREVQKARFRFAQQQDQNHVLDAIKRITA